MAKEPEEKVEKNEPKNHYSVIGHTPGWVYALVAVIILVIVLLIGVGIGNHWRNRNVSFVRSSGVRLENPGGPRQFMAGGGGGFFNNNTSGQNRSEGVVTSVNGSNFTIASNGSTTNVTTNSSTQYQDGSSVKQNDTVLVYGTESGNTITATEVVINP